MLNDRERRILARIERQLVESDPDLVRLFDHHVAVARGNVMATFLLVAGLSLLVLGCVVAAVPVAVVGMAISVFALFTAFARTGSRPLWSA